MKRYAALTVLAGLCVWGPDVHAQEIKLGNNDTSEMSLSIYNQNLAQVRDVRQADLKSGVSTVAFEGVAQQMKPETSLLDANGITVLEKNYEYDLLTYNNILTESIGQEVKTVMTNPQTGANIFNKAVVVNSNYGSPLLKFDYGIEGTFPGRVVFDKLPENLRVKPTLVAKVLAENEIMIRTEVKNISDEERTFNLTSFTLQIGMEHGGSVDPYVYPYLNPGVSGSIVLGKEETKTVTLAFPIEKDALEAGEQIKLILALYPVKYEIVL